MAKWNSEKMSAPIKSDYPITMPTQQVKEAPPVATVYADSPGEFNFYTLQQNLQNCLSIVDNEVMKNYVPALQHCSVIPCDKDLLAEINDDSRFIQFFRITELVYQEDEFSVHKLATVFHALSNKPCTLVLMIQSDGKTNNFYLGVRSRGTGSTGTMKHLLEQSLLGLFPGSDTEEYLQPNLVCDLKQLSIGCISSVTCIADYKQEKESLENKDFIQGLEKFIYSMQGKAFTAICIANNLEYRDLVDTRKEYERIYTLMSPFANMQYNYALSNSSATTKSDTYGDSQTDTTGTSTGVTLTDTQSKALQQGTNQAQTITDTEGTNTSLGVGQSHTVGVTDGVNDSETVTITAGTYVGTSKNAGVNIGGASVGMGTNTGVTSSVARGKTHGTSHSDSVSDSISRNLTFGINASKAIGNTIGESRSQTDTRAIGIGTQQGENLSHSISSNTAHTTALAETFGNSRAVTLNVQNKSLINMLQRLEKQLDRLDECESIGMWDFAAYFLGESAAEAETAASMYRSLVSGNQSGLEIASVNTWTDATDVEKIAKYVTNFLHPVFRYKFEDGSMSRETLVDATALVSTNELAIQLGLPRKSVKGLPVIEHALFAQEVLSENAAEDQADSIVLGEINHLGRDTGTDVNLDLQSLSMHTFVTGSTGAGKSNTVYQILSQLPEKKIKFLVIEPAKGEYKNIFGKTNDVTVYGTNPLLNELLRINPFSFPKEVHIYEHLDRLVEIFNVCWPMYAAMPAILKDAIERSYVKAGWDLRKSTNKYSNKLFPNFIDVLQQIDIVMEQSQYSSDNKGDYKGALSTRLRSLTNGINGLLFTSDEISASDLFDKNVIVDLSRVGSSETKSLIMGLLVMKLQEHRIASCTEMNAKLNHITVLEEAHNLLKRTSTEQSAESSNLLGKSVEMLTSAIAEMRTYGEGFIIADQSPGLLDMSVIRNTNTKIIMRLPEYSDRELVGRAASLKDEQIAELAKLPKGVAAVYQNDWVQPVLCKVSKYDRATKLYSYTPSDETELDDAENNASDSLLDCIMGKEIFGAGNRTEIRHLANKVLRSKLDTNVKKDFIEYVSASDEDAIASLRHLIYRFLSAEEAITTAAKCNNINDWVHTVVDGLNPSIKEYSNKQIDLVLALILYEKSLNDSEYNDVFCRFTEIYKSEGGVF